MQMFLSRTTLGLSLSTPQPSASGRVLRQLLLRARLLRPHVAREKARDDAREDAGDDGAIPDELDGRLAKTSSVREDVSRVLNSYCYEPDFIVGTSPERRPATTPRDAVRSTTERSLTLWFSVRAERRGTRGEDARRPADARPASPRRAMLARARVATISVTW